MISSKTLYISCVHALHLLAIDSVTRGQLSLPGAGTRNAADYARPSPFAFVKTDQTISQFSSPTTTNAQILAGS